MRIAAALAVEDAVEAEAEVVVGAAVVEVAVGDEAGGSR